ncbi:hypothetical protein ACLOJK_009541 [Asimina triloba]
MASSLMQFLVSPSRNIFARMHCKALSKRLRKYGLRYDDLYDPMYDLDIKEALARLPREIVDARHQRLKRAMDLSMKHEYLPEDLQFHPGKERESRTGGTGSFASLPAHHPLIVVLCFAAWIYIALKRKYVAGSSLAGALDDELVLHVGSRKLMMSSFINMVDHMFFYLGAFGDREREKFPTPFSLL